MANSLLPLDTLAGTIKAHKAAGDKATGKAEEHYTAAGLHLIEAQERITAMKKAAPYTWTYFLEYKCEMAPSRAYEFIALAGGTDKIAPKTVEEVRERSRTSSAATYHKYKAAAASSASSGETAEKPQQNQSEQPTTTERMKVFDRIVLILRRLDERQIKRAILLLVEEFGDE